MIGCGKFDEIILLRYLDNELDSEAADEVERHLSECDLCANEIVELNRINTLMEIGEPLQIPNRVIVRLLFRDNTILNFQSNFPGVIAPQQATRGVNPDVQGFRMSIPVSEESGDESSAGITVLPAGSDSCWLIIEYARLESEQVELVRVENDGDGSPKTIPLFLKHAEGPSVTIKGLKHGDYQLNFLGNSVTIHIDSQSS